MIHRALLGLTLLFGCHAVAFAQEVKCGLGPIISVSCPTDIAPIGSRVTVAGSISGGDPFAGYTYHWEVSAGKIINGQGTSEITIEVGAETTTVTLKVGGAGLSEESNNTASCTFSTIVDAAARKFAEFGHVNQQDEERALAEFAQQLRDMPTARAYIIIYGRAGQEELKDLWPHFDRMAEYLTDRQGIESRRIGFDIGSERCEFKIELWTVPAGASNPIPTPEF